MVSPFWRAVCENPTPQELRRRVRAACRHVSKLSEQPCRCKQSISQYPEEETSVWVEDLPPNITTHQLLEAIRDIERVWQTHTVRPSGHHVTAAAKCPREEVYDENKDLTTGVTTPRAT
ncbi:hypothetical protein C8A01DRAFT_36422 [Parachaetomium inaequale]|uniref:Uncharacterized protein n=1 Tax=Parachaetomium inaequale TaxID=2588326 RepID=A0AAN6PJ91_9PEZI|nr:hypothetical protein C8A01DRAFT_36422 [Parachaetomium inaequale]